MKVFFDTGVFIALLIKKELDHDRVVEKYTVYRRQNAQMYTSDYILAELWTWCSRSLNSTQTKSIMDATDAMATLGQLTILPVDTNVFKRAQSMLLKYFEHRLSLVDCTTVVLVRDFHMDEIFTLDSDFRKLRLPVSFLSRP